MSTPTGLGGMSYFFLSYARGVDDPYVRDFFNRLCDEVRAHAALRAQVEVGFMDVQSIPLGSLWGPALADALATSRVYIPLQSRGYWQSDSCGKEWAIFERRVRRHQQLKGSSNETWQLPLTWLPSKLPPVAAAIQNSAPWATAAYGEGGLRPLMMSNRHSDALQDLLTALAQNIIRVAEDSPLTEGERLDFAQVTSAFHEATPVATAESTQNPAGGGDPPTDPRWSRRGRGPRHAHVVVASGGRRDLQNLRADLSYYGDDAQDWAPFRPAVPEPIGSWIEQVADGAKFQTELAGLDDLDHRLDFANAQNEIVMLVVDPWAITLPDNRPVLESFDRRNEPTTPLLLPFNEEDQETQQAESRLRTNMRQIFPHNYVRDDLIRHDVTRPGQFAGAMVDALATAQSRVLKRGPVYRQAAGPQPPQRPWFESP